MPAERLPMRKIREVLRLKYACGASDRVISRSVGIGRTAIAEYVRRAAVIGITWPIPEEIDDTALERKLFAPAGYNPPRSKPLPDWGHVHAELRRRGVTLALLWEEYRGHDPDDGYGYSRFCDLYVEWRHGIALPDWIGAHVDALTFLGGGAEDTCPRQSEGWGHGGEPPRAGVNRTSPTQAAHANYAIARRGRTAAGRMRASYLG
jgi:hypothetical protein